MRIRKCLSLLEYDAVRDGIRILPQKLLQPGGSREGCVGRMIMSYVILTHLRTKFCRLRTLVRLQVLKASDAASTACSNSVWVVCGTRESSVWVDWGEAWQVSCRYNMPRQTTYRIHHVYPL